MRCSHFLLTVGCWLGGAVAVAQPPAALSEATELEARADKLLAFQTAVQAAVRELDEQLTTVFATGTITRRIEKEGRIEVRAHDLQIVTNGPKFRVQLIENPSLTTIRSADPANPQPVADPLADPLANRAEAKSHVVIFDGENVYSVRFSPDGIAAKAQFAFQQQSALRTAGYPFHPPLKLWQCNPLPVSATPEQYQLQPLQGDGRVVHLKSVGYSVKYYFFGEFEYDLRRIAFFAPNVVRPFREVSYQWGEEEGVRFVSRFSIRDRHVSSDPADTRREISDLTVELQNISVNPNDVSQSAFELADLELPVGTQFEDQRKNKMGKPAVLIWDGKKLREDD